MVVLPVHVAAVGHGLAGLAPERASRIRSLQAMANGAATPAARRTQAAVYPQALLRTAGVGGTALLAAIGDDRVA